MVDFANTWSNLVTIVLCVLIIIGLMAGIILNEGTIRIVCAIFLGGMIIVMGWFILSKKKEGTE